MYDTPRLIRLGTFRELTRQSSIKDALGHDLIPGVGVECSSTAAAANPAACGASPTVVRS